MEIELSEERLDLPEGFMETAPRVNLRELVETFHCDRTCGRHRISTCLGGFNQPRNWAFTIGLFGRTTDRVYGGKRLDRFESANTSDI